MTRDQLGVYRRITDPETEGTPDSQLRVQDCERVIRFAHGASSKRMVEGLHPVPDDLAELLVAQLVKVVVEKRVSAADVSDVSKRSRMGNSVCHTKTANHGIEIMPSGEVAGGVLSNGRKKKGTQTDFGSMVGLSQGFAEFI